MARPRCSRARGIVLTCFIALLACANRVTAGGFERIESAFDVPGVNGNPFDFTENDVKVTFSLPDASRIVLPAFFDGELWRVRHTPNAPGRYQVVSVSRNGTAVAPKSIVPQSFDVAGTPGPGFIRIDPGNKFRFVHDDKSLFYPLGFNHAWRNKGDPAKPTIPQTLKRMSSVGANWVRIWMNHWDLKNLDWIEDQTVPLGSLDLGVARTWDEILAAGEANGVYIQLALQHHGQFSTRADANWQLNPWNKANGGWLESSADFFTDEKARALTRAKYRYIIARFGYSPAIMAWELFNEVEGTDAYQSNFDSVVAWHNEMARFIREQDPYKHLITTSSRTTDAKLWPAMDYYNAHVYAPDIVTAIQTLEAEKLDRAYFYGEIGSAAFGAQSNPQQTIHECLWASLMSQSSGAAQYWFWDLIEDNDLFGEYRSASAFLTQSRILAQSGLAPIEVVAETANRGALRFGPGTGWSASRTTQFNVRPSGFVDGVGGMSAYLQGTLNEKNKAMFPFAEFAVNYSEPGTFSIAMDEITQDGATLNIAVDGKPVTSLTMLAPPTGAAQPGPADRPRRNPRINTSISLPVAAGEHVIRLENTGKDWIHLRQFTLDPYAPELAALGKGSDQYAAIWVYRREPGESPINGTLNVPGLKPGTYHVSWFDTSSGQTSRAEVIRSTGSTFSFASGPVQSDVAIWIEPTTDSPATRPAH